MILRFQIEEGARQRTAGRHLRCPAGKRGGQIQAGEGAIAVEELEARGAVVESRVAGTKAEALGIRIRNHNGGAGEGDKCC